MNTSQRGADWKAGGELKVLHRIMPPVISDAEDAVDDALPSRTHNGPPAAVFNVSAEDVELEGQALIVEKVLGESVEADHVAETKRVRVGRELLALQQIFLAGTERRYQKIVELRDAGNKWIEIANIFGVSASGVRRAYAHKTNPKRRDGQSKEGQSFTIWAMKRFGISKANMVAYLKIGRIGIGAERAHKNRSSSRTRALANLVRVEEKQKITPTVFKKAFMALEPPARRATLLWACSTMIGSEDPQEIARWFANALAGR